MYQIIIKNNPERRTTPDQKRKKENENKMYPFSPSSSLSALLLPFALEFEDDDDDDVGPTGRRAKKRVVTGWRVIEWK
jgi:hypothetical protein